MRNVPTDTRPLHREFIAEALDAVATMAEWGRIFLERGDDARAEAAMRPAVNFMKLAASEMNALLAENRQRVEDETRGGNFPPLLPEGYIPTSGVSAQIDPKHQEVSA